MTQPCVRLEMRPRRPLPMRSRTAEIIVLAVPWGAVPDAVASCGDLTGRVLIDVTNPLIFANGALWLALGFDTSGGEEIASLAKGAQVYKTLTWLASK